MKRLGKYGWFWRRETFTVIHNHRQHAIDDYAEISKSTQVTSKAGELKKRQNVHLKITPPHSLHVLIQLHDS